jgi:hypothetical protein
LKPEVNLSNIKKFIFFLHTEGRLRPDYEHRSVNAIYSDDCHSLGGYTRTLTVEPRVQSLATPRGNRGRFSSNSLAFRCWAPAFHMFMPVWFGLRFYPKDRGGKFLRNVGLSPNYTALQPRRHFLHSNCCENPKSSIFINVVRKFMYSKNYNYGDCAKNVDFMWKL